MFNDLHEDPAKSPKRNDHFKPILQLKPHSARRNVPGERVLSNLKSKNQSLCVGKSPSSTSTAQKQAWSNTGKKVSERLDTRGPPTPSSSSLPPSSSFSTPSSSSSSSSRERERENTCNHDVVVVVLSRQKHGTCHCTQVHCHPFDMWKFGHCY